MNARHWEYQTKIQHNPLQSGNPQLSVFWERRVRFEQEQKSRPLRQALSICFELLPPDSGVGPSSPTFAPTDHLDFWTKSKSSLSPFSYWPQESDPLSSCWLAPRLLYQLSQGLASPFSAWPWWVFLSCTGAHPGGPFPPASVSSTPWQKLHLKIHYFICI